MRNSRQLRLPAVMRRGEQILNNMLGEQAEMLHLYLLWCLLGTDAQGQVSLQPLAYSPWIAAIRPQGWKAE